MKSGAAAATGTPITPTAASVRIEVVTFFMTPSFGGECAKLRSNEKHQPSCELRRRLRVAARGHPSLQERDQQRGTPRAASGGSWVRLASDNSRTPAAPAQGRTSVSWHETGVRQGETRGRVSAPPGRWG